MSIAEVERLDRDIPQPIERHVSLIEAGGEYLSPEDAVRNGWQFTARYIRCDGEPVETACPFCRYRVLGDTGVCAVCGGSGRGLFVPLPSERGGA